MSNAARLLTDSELSNFEQELEATSALVQKGDSSAEEGLNVVRNIKKAMDTRGMNLTPEEISEERKRIWSLANGFESYFKDMIFQNGLGQPAKFQPGDVIDGETVKLIMRATTEIINMPNRQEDEIRVRDLISSVNNYGKLVHSEHVEMKKLWKKYNDKVASNIMAYAKSNQRNPNRDKAFIEKLQTGLRDGKYSNVAQVQAAMTLLEPKIPQA